MEMELLQCWLEQKIYFLPIDPFYSFFLVLGLNSAIFEGISINKDFENKNKYAKGRKKR